MFRRMFSGLEFGYADPAHTDELVAFVTKLFANKEALGQLLDISYDELLPYMKAICHHSIQQRGAIVAIDGASDRIVGFTIGEQQSERLNCFPTDIVRDNPRPMQIFEMLDELGKPFDDNYSHLADETAHFFMMGLSFRHVSRKMGRFRRLAFQVGYMNELIKFGQRLAKKRGFRYILAETSGARSQKYASLWGAKELNRIYYKDHFNVEDQALKRVSQGDSCGLYLHKM